MTGKKWDLRRGTWKSEVARWRRMVATPAERRMESFKRYARSNGGTDAAEKRRRTSSDGTAAAVEPLAALAAAAAEADAPPKEAGHL